MTGEMARHYPAGALPVSTGRYAGSEAVDPDIPQAVDRVAVPARRLRTITGLIRWTARANALARSQKPGFVWCGELKPAAYPARWLVARHGLPYGILVHNSTELLLLQEKSRRSRFKRRIARALLERAAVVVANSRWTGALAQEVLASHGLPALAADVRIVPLGTDPEHFRPVDSSAVRAKYGLDDGVWLLTVARVHRVKGIDTVIKALPAIRAAFPRARYAVAGAGPYRAEFEQLATSLGLGDAVRFLGPVGTDDLPGLYSAATLYVGASRRERDLNEGFGIAFVEASACGLAIVGGRTGGVPEAVKDGETGLLIEPDEPRAVADGVCRLLGDTPLRERMGAAGRHAAVTYFNWARVVQDLRAIDQQFRRD
jgi:phosphatidyl-myo-inositol dimannoside synthase